MRDNGQKRQRRDSYSLKVSYSVDNSTLVGNLCHNVYVKGKGVDLIRLSIDSMDDARQSMINHIDHIIEKLMEAREEINKKIQEE